MIRDAALKKKLYNLCTLDALESSDPRNVDIDTVYPGARGHRPWVRRIADKLILSERPECVLVSGLPGAGKSTELKRLKSTLEAESPAFFVAFVQAENWIDLSMPLSEAELFSMMLYQVEEQLLVLEKKSQSPMAEGSFARFWRWVTNTEITVTGAKTSLKAGAKAKEPVTGSEISAEVGGDVHLELKTDPSLRALVRDRLKQSPGEFFRRINDEFRQQAERARRLRAGGMVVLVDSLEKLRGTTDSANDVVASVEQLFRAEGHVTDLPMHAVFTVPPTQIVRAPTRTQFIPLIQVTRREGGACQPGVDAAIAIVKARLNDAALNEILGAQNREDDLRKIVTQTGGYPRAMMRLLRELIATHDDQTDRVIQQTLRDEANVYNLGLPASSYAWLASVARTHDLALLESTPAAMRDRDLALTSEVVLWYHNDDAWFDLAPAVRGLPSVVEAVKRAAKASAAQES